MSLGLVGRKVGMTRIFAEDGKTIPVTVLDVSDNRVSQIKTIDTDGYAAVQVAYGKRRASRITKPVAGHLAKAGVEPCRGIKEFRVEAEQAGGMNAGDAIGADLFQVGQKVDVTGVTIGKGFSGPIKRHNFSSNRASHGNSISHNSPGFDRYGPGSGSCVPRQAHGGPVRQRAAHHAGSRDRSRGRRAPAPSREGCGAGCQGWRRRRPSGGQGLRSAQWN